MGTKIKAKQSGVKSDAAAGADKGARDGLKEPLRLYLTAAGRELLAGMATRLGETPAIVVGMVLGWGLGAEDLARGARSTRWRDLAPGLVREVEPDVFDIVLCSAARRSLEKVRTKYDHDAEPGAFSMAAAAELVLGDAFNVVDLANDVARWWDAGEWPCCLTTDFDGTWTDWRRRGDAEDCARSVGGPGDSDRSSVVDLAAMRELAALRETAEGKAEEALGELRVLARWFLAASPEELRPNAERTSILDQLARAADKAMSRTWTSIELEKREAL